MIGPYLVTDKGRNGVILPHSDRVLFLSDVNSQIQRAKSQIDHLTYAQSHRNTHGGKRFRAKQISLRDQVDSCSKRLTLLTSAQDVIVKLDRVLPTMRFEIGKGGIASVEFTVSLGNIKTRLTMTMPVEDKPGFYSERERLSGIFGASYLYDGCIEVWHGRFSENTFLSVKAVVEALYEKSMIDLQTSEDMMKWVEGAVERLKIEHDQKTPLFTDFETNVARPFKDVTIHKDFSYLMDNGIRYDTSINDLFFVNDKVGCFNGNAMKVGTHWVYLFACEGALEHLVNSLSDSNTRERFAVLQRGITKFLQKHEKELHAVVNKTITDDSVWFQQLYTDYKVMVATGKSPSNDIKYGMTNNMGIGDIRLYLPNRFAK
jgi:hypothetical protein